MWYQQEAAAEHHQHQNPVPHNPSTESAQQQLQSGIVSKKIKRNVSYTPRYLFNKMHILQIETNPEKGADSLQISNTTTKRSLQLDQKASRD